MRSMMTRWAPAACLGAHLLGCSRGADAGFVSVNFTGTVTSGNVEFSGFPGSAVLGTFGYDPAATPLAGSTPTTGLYATGTISFAVPSMGFSYVGNSSRTTVSHNPGVQDELVIDATDGTASDVVLTITDPTGTSLTSTALPPVLAFAPGSTFDLHYYGHLAFAQFDSSIVPSAAVPEPTSLALCGIAGALATGWFGWRRSRRRAA